MYQIHENGKLVDDSKILSAAYEAVCAQCKDGQEVVEVDERGNVKRRIPDVERRKVAAVFYNSSTH